jgi:hypothetical protein
VTQLEVLDETYKALSPPSKMTGNDLDGIDTLLANLLPEVSGLTSAHRTACEEDDTLAKVKRERTADFVAIQHKRNEHSMAAIRETVYNPATDTNSLGLSRLALEQEVQLLQDTLDFIEYVLCPAARDKKLETRRDLLRAEHLEAALYCARSHATMLQKLESAGLSQTHGRIIAYSEVTQRLELAATEAHRLAQQSEAELTAFRAARLARTQQRHADGLTTKAEAMYSALELSRVNTPESKTE